MSDADAISDRNAGLLFVAVVGGFFLFGVVVVLDAVLWSFPSEIGARSEPGPAALVVSFSVAATDGGVTVTHRSDESLTTSRPTVAANCRVRGS